MLSCIELSSIASVCIMPFLLELIILSFKPKIRVFNVLVHKHLVNRTLKGRNFTLNIY